ncbi:MAG: hypothetical protein GF335_00585 [Candidatus Moranbacteria bacterium]|nr:hypothetical protein [Candidatus Moranbacteria bacterium]
MFDKDFLQTQKEKLKQQKEEIQSQLENIAQKDDEIEGNYKTKFPDYGEKMEDNAEEYETYESNVAIEQNLEIELQKINEALEKIENKPEEYGICSNCNKQIKKERLEIRPQAKKCMSCKT